MQWKQTEVRAGSQIQQTVFLWGYLLLEWWACWEINGSFDRCSSLRSTAPHLICVPVWAGILSSSWHGLCHQYWVLKASHPIWFLKTLFSIGWRWQRSIMKQELLTQLNILITKTFTKQMPPCKLKFLIDYNVDMMWSITHSLLISFMVLPSSWLKSKDTALQGKRINSE